MSYWRTTIFILKSVSSTIKGNLQPRFQRVTVQTDNFNNPKRPLLVDRTESKPQSTPASCYAGACRSHNQPYVGESSHVSEPSGCQHTFHLAGSILTTSGTKLPPATGHLGFSEENSTNQSPALLATKGSGTISRQACVGSGPPRIRLRRPFRSRRLPHVNR